MPITLPLLRHSGHRTRSVRRPLVLIVSTRRESYGFAGGGFGVRQEGGSEGVTGFRSESSGLEIPTRRNSFPMTRTMGRIFHLSNVKPTLFLMNDAPPRTGPYLQAR